MFKRFIAWFLKWQWAIALVWLIALLELITGDIVPWMHVLSNWLIVFIGGMLIVGFLSQMVSK